MNPTRIAILGVALLAGVGAFFLMMNNKPEQAPVTQVVERVQEETVRVLIATRDIQRGERMSAEDTTWLDWPKKGIRPNFITDATPDARENLATAVARSLIVSGEPIVNAKVVRPGNSGLMAAILAPGMRAVTLRVSPETSSGGFILPGDRIDLMHTTNGSTRVIFEDVRVLAVNAMYSETSETPHVPGDNMTLELAPDDAEVFLSKRATGAYSVVLRSIFKPEGDEATRARRQTNVNVIRYGRS